MQEKTFKFFLGNQLTEKPSRNKGTGTGDRSEELGHVFIGAADPAHAKSCRSYSTLMKIVEGEINGMPVTYWKPNTFYRSDISQKGCLRWLNAFFIDLDEEGLFLQDVLERIREAGLPDATLINQTPHGWHIYWAIEPARAWPEKVKRYEDITRAMVKALPGADPQAASGQKFMRIPRNVKYFTEVRYTIEDFEDWFVINDLDVPAPPQKARVYYMTECLIHPAMQELLKGVDEGWRDNACFTLALAFYKDGHASDKAMIALKEWNLKNSLPLPFHIIPQKVRSAFSGKYHGPADSYVYDLTGIHFYGRPVTPAKPREKRVRDHLWEVQDDILKYVERHGGHVSFTQSFFAEILGVALSTFKAALKALRKAGKLIAFIDGRGKARKAIYAILGAVAGVVRERQKKGVPDHIDGFKTEQLIQKLMVHSGIHLGVVVGGFAWGPGLLCPRKLE